MSSNEGQARDLKSRFLAVVLARPVVVLLLFVLVSAVLGWQATRFEIDASPETLLTRDNALYVQTQQVNQRFAPQEFLLVIYQPRDGSMFDEQTFSALENLSEELGNLERVESVRSILNVPVFTGLEGPQALDADLQELTIARGDFSVEELEEAFAGHPVYENLLVNEEQTATALQVLFRGNEELGEINGRITELLDQRLDGSLSNEQQRELASLEARAEPLEAGLQRQRAEEVEAIREIAAGHEDRAEIRLGGVHAIGYQLIEIISNDLLVFGAAIAGLICLLLVVLFRGLRWVMIPVVCCISSVLCTMGLFALLGLKATVISANFIALQLILTLGIVIHLIVQYREAVADRPDAGQAELVSETLKRKIGPCFYAGLTTSVGFASLVFSGIQPVIMFGWMMIIAMAFSIAVSLLLFPVLVVLLPRGGTRRDMPILRQLSAGFRHLVLRRPAWVVSLSLALLAAGVSGAFLLDVENSFINYFKPSTQVHQELAYIDREFGGTTPLDIVYSLEENPEDSEIVFRAETVTRLQRMQQWLSEYEATGRILSPVNLTDLARQVNDGQPLTEYELTGLYWMMDDALREDLLGAFFHEETGQVRFNVWIQDLTEGLDRAQLLSDIRADLAEQGVEEDEYTMSNLFVLYQDIMQRLFDSQLRTLLLVYAALAVMFLLIFRSVATALVALAPNMLSTAVIFGVMGWAGIPLDLMTITIAAVVMGIAVDDTIHYTHRYREELPARGAEQAIARSHASVGMAVIYTTLIIAAGFSLLAFSDFVPSMIFGLLTALAMLVALLADLSLLPLLLRRFVTR